jgi:hypothetical protein
MYSESMDVPFSHYVALGDSTSMDLYPALDAGEIDVAVALERRASAGEVARLGAASLLHANDAAHWPEFAGRDLVTRVPGATVSILAADGATVGEVFGEQLPLLMPSDAPTLVTLTVGGQDLLSAFASRPGPRRLTGIVRDIAHAYEYLVGTVTHKRPNAVLLLTTIYDPSDRTGLIPGTLEGAGRLPLEHLDALNTRIREIAARTSGTRVADAYAHFLGHGVSVPETERWYWRRSLTEPSAIGASELRRVWLEALGL